MPYLTKTAAQKIVERIVKIIPYEICIMDAEGTAIAGSERMELGIRHPEAVRAIELEEACITYRDSENGRKGIHFPICFNQMVEGVIAVYGELDDIMQIGQIVVTLAELIMENEVFHEISATRRSRLNDFLYEWTQRTKEEYDERFQSQAEFWQIDLRIERVALIISMERTRYSVVEQVRGLLHGNDYLVRQGFSALVLLLAADSGLEHRIDQILALSSDFKKCYIGPPDVIVFRSIKAAERIRDMAELFRYGERKVYYRDFALESMLSDVEADRGILELAGLFRGGQGNILRDTIIAYARKGEDHQKVCESLFVHRNTLNYRLEKIHTLSGLNPRNGRELMLLYLAAMHSLYHPDDGGTDAGKTQNWSYEQITGENNG